MMGARPGGVVGRWRKPLPTKAMPGRGPGSQPVGDNSAMTLDLFRDDGYLRACEATVLAVGEHGIVLDRTVFYPLGGGQAGDSGLLVFEDGSRLAIADTRKARDDQGQPTSAIWHLPAPGQEALLATVQAGQRATAQLDWERRHKLMRFHTTTHLLCHLVPQLVNGCSITPDYARLDFNMTEALDKAQLTAGIARLVAAGHPVTVGAITDAELDANPALVKSMSVQPPRGSGRVRTIRVGGDELVDYQPCGGTHVANTAEIGAVVVTRIEKKSATTRRVVLGFA
jgi:misacylated tRNA(Ala) deacylase